MAWTKYKFLNAWPEEDSLFEPENPTPRIRPRKNCSVIQRTVPLYYLANEGRHCLIIAALLNVPDIPLYPDTFETGIGSCIDIADLPETVVVKLISRLQYGHTQNRSAHNRQTYSKFLNCNVTRTTWKCSRIYKTFSF